MFSSTATILMNDGTTENAVSKVVVGDRVYNPITGKPSVVSAVLHRFYARSGNGSDLPVKFETRSLNRRFPSQPVWLSSGAVVLYPQKVQDSQIPRIALVKAKDLVGNPGIEFEEHPLGMSFTKIVLADAGLLCVQGVVVEAPALSIAHSRPSPILNGAFAGRAFS